MSTKSEPVVASSKTETNKRREQSRNAKRRNKPCNGTQAKTTANQKKKVLRENFERPDEPQVIKTYGEIKAVHAACQAVRPLSAKEWTSLCISIDQSSTIDPLTITKSGLLVDGRHRALAAIATKKTRLVKFQFVDDDEVEEIVARRLIGRNASMLERCRVAAIQLDLAQAEGKDPHPITIARRFGVTKTTFYRYRLVAKADKQLLEKVHAGESTLTEAKNMITERSLRAKAGLPAGESEPSKPAKKRSSSQASNSVKSIEPTVASDEQRENHQDAEKKCDEIQSATTPPPPPKRSRLHPTVLLDDGPIVVAFDDVRVVAMRSNGEWQIDVHDGETGTTQSAKNHDDALKLAEEMAKSEKEKRDEEESGEL